MSYGLNFSECHGSGSLLTEMLLALEKASIVLLDLMKLGVASHEHKSLKAV
jgi:hypothetical protein